MADTQEKVVADKAVEAAKEDSKADPDVPEENEKPKRGRRSANKKSNIAQVQEEAEMITKGLAGTEVEGRRMTRSALRGTPSVTPSPPPKKERKSTGASGGGGKSAKRGRQRKLVKEEEEDEEEDEELEEGEKKAKAPKKAEENGDDAHEDEEEEVSKAGKVEEKAEEKMDVDEAKDEPEKVDEVKPVLNNTEKGPAAAALESEKKEDTPAEKSVDSKVNNVVDGEKKPSEKTVTENSIAEKTDETASNENKSPSEEAAPAKGVAQEPVSVSQ